MAKISFFRCFRVGQAIGVMTLVLIGVLFAGSTGAQDTAPQAESTESQFLSEVRQLTFDGLRAGEGYFSRDGKKLVFQSEREKENPFFQIYLLDFDSLEIQRVSPGHGKTTCSWVHPNGQEILFASTHEDPDAIKKQKDEFALREAGNKRRYSWDYDDKYELYSYNLTTKEYRRLSNTLGYDAEACFSPDGKQIVFASNRSGYTDKLDPPLAEKFKIDLSLMSDLYIMNADGTNVRKLTNEIGYDGGPFFSHDGSKICYRHFAEDGVTAEIMTMNLDGSDKRQLTRLGVSSWAPYFHPSGEYLIFTTNKHGFDNFELYLVDAAGKAPPVRVTETAKFDGLASFSPDGTMLTWTSERSSNGSSQIFLAKWNHEAARRALGLDAIAASDDEARDLAKSNASDSSVDFRGIDMMKHVDYLCHPTLEGRMTGSLGERKATAYVAAYFDYLGLEPAGDNGTWFQSFDFSAGAKLGPKNKLEVGNTAFELDRQWRPLTFSRIGDIESSGVVFAGYGITAPKDGENEEYDSYAHLDVKDKWVMMFRYSPENAGDAQRQHLQFHSNLRKKAMEARDKGARGIIIVSGPTSLAREQLVPLEQDFSMSGSSIAGICVNDEVAASWFELAGKELREVQEQHDTGKPTVGFEIPGLNVHAQIDLAQVNSKGRNAIGRLVAGERPSDQAVLVGAHIDHLGNGRSSNSLARDDETTYIHFGADDNASGVAAMLEVAENLARLKRDGKLQLKRDLIFAAWSGEEIGLIGSQYFVDNIRSQTGSSDSQSSAPVDPVAAAHAGLVSDSSIYPKIGACLNMDMVGRYNGSLVLQGIASSPYWTRAAEKNAAIGLTLRLSNDTNLPTDASSFYRAGVPILAAFTGSHSDYHTPRDTPDKLNYEDAARIAKLMGLIARGLAVDENLPEYVKVEGQVAERPRAAMRAYLGSIPEYGGDVQGVLLGGVTSGSPVEKAGLQKGDIIVELAGRKIENVYDYTYAIEALKPGQETTIAILRGDQRIELKVTPGRR